jgi:hypothetical protein
MVGNAFSPIFLLFVVEQLTFVLALQSLCHDVGPTVALCDSHDSPNDRSSADAAAFSQRRDGAGSTRTWPIPPREGTNVGAFNREISEAS